MKISTDEYQHLVNQHDNNNKPITIRTSPGRWFVLFVFSMVAICQASKLKMIKYYITIHYNNIYHIILTKQYIYINKPINKHTQ